MFALIFAIIAFIFSLVTFALVTLNTAEWGKSKAIDAINWKIAVWKINKQYK